MRLLSNERRRRWVLVASDGPKLLYVAGGPLRHLASARTLLGVMSTMDGPQLLAFIDAGGPASFLDLAG